MSKVIKLQNYRAEQFYISEEYFNLLKEIEDLEYNIEYGEGILDWYANSMSEEEIEWYTALNANEKQRLEYLKHVLLNIERVI